MNEFQSLRKSSIEGILSFALRSVLINILKFLSVYLLAIWFVPEDYGTFGITLSWFGVSCFFCDIGLASVLVQQRQTPSRRQLETTLALQLTLSTVLALIFIIMAPEIAEYNGLGNGAIEMIRLLFVSLPILAARNPSKIQLERALGFKAIAAIELIESLVLYLVQLFLAWKGLGALSVIWANVARTLIGTSLYFIKSETWPIPKFHLKTLKAMIPLGSKYQANALLPSLKAMVFPLVVGKILDVKTLGLVSWTIGIVALPQFIALNYNSIFFPIFSKLKGDKGEFKRMNKWALTLILPMLAVLYILMALFCAPLASLIFSEKWAGAFAYFELATIGFFLYLTRYLLAPFFNASGKPQTRIKLEVTALLVELFSAGIGSYFYGATGYLSAIILTNGFILLLSVRELDRELAQLLAQYTGIFAGLYIVAKLPTLWLTYWIAAPISTLILIMTTLVVFGDYREILKRKITKLRS